MYLMQIVSQVWISKIPVLNIAEWILILFPIKRRGKKDIFKIEILYGDKHEPFLQYVAKLCDIKQLNKDLGCVGSQKILQCFCYTVVVFWNNKKVAHFKLTW